MITGKSNRIREMKPPKVEINKTSENNQETKKKTKIDLVLLVFFLVLDIKKTFKKYNPFLAYTINKK